MAATHDLVERFLTARSSAHETVLEGFHPIKHALRFGAQLDEVVVLAGTHVADLPVELVEAGIAPAAVEAETFDRLVPSRPPVPIVARAPRVVSAAEEIAAATDPGAVVLLEDPTHLGNTGAVIRVVAAAGAAGVVVTGTSDPWHPQAVRGAAGLQYALPVAHAEVIPETDRPLVAFDPEGEDLRSLDCPPRPLLVFGTERRGVSPNVLERAELVVAIPMRPRVSSLNLATAVAVGLYAFSTPSSG